MEAGSTFNPTHTAPEGGLPTWSAPDPATAADNRLGPLLEVQLLEEATGWTHILCANGWTAWVDSRYLVPLPPAASPAVPAPAAPPTAAGAAGAPPSFSPPASVSPAGTGPPAAAAPPPSTAPPAAAPPGASPASTPPSASPAGTPPAAVPPTAGQPVPAAAPKKGGCGRIFLFGCLGLILVVIIVGVGIFIALRSGALTTDKLLNLVGQGPAAIEFDNLRDDSIQAAVDSPNSSSSSGGSTSSGGSSGGSGACGFSLSGGCVMLNPFDVKQHRVENPGKYKVTFLDKSGATIGTCTLDIHGGDHYQFVALPAQIAVNKGNDPSKRGSDYDIKTSSLCKP